MFLRPFKFYPFLYLYISIYSIPFYIFINHLIISVFISSLPAVYFYYIPYVPLVSIIFSSICLHSICFYYFPYPSVYIPLVSIIHSFIQHNFIDREKTTFTFTHLVIHNDTNYTIFRSIFWGNPQGQVFNFLNFIKPPLQPSTLPVFPPFF